MLNSNNVRLSKRDGAVTLRQLLAEPGREMGDVIRLLARSLGYDAEGISTAADLLERFIPDKLSRKPFVWDGTV